jgi:excinuclease ABC subunit A
MTVHRLSEIDTPAFRDFLAAAVKSYRDSLTRMTTKPEDLMPWKVMGEKWHLGPKGFPPGRKLHWDTGILPRLVDLVREVEPTIEIAWNNRMTVAFRCADIGRAWAQWITKSPAGLVCRFLGKKGQFNLTQIEKFGVSPTLTPYKNGEMMMLVFRDDNHIHAAALRELLKSHLAGFREAFAKK